MAQILINLQVVQLTNENRCTIHKKHPSLLYEFVVDVHESFEIFHGFHFQFHRSILVTYEDCALVLLEGGYSPHVVHTLLDCLVEGERFVHTGDYDHHLTQSTVIIFTSTL